MSFWLLEQSVEISYHAIALVFQVPDKADYRTYAAQALVNLLNKLPCIEFADFIAWLYKYSRNTKVSMSPWCSRVQIQQYFEGEGSYISTQ